MTNLTDPMFHNEDAARAYFEAMRWPDGPYCPHCGNSDQAKITKLNGKSHRAGLHQCNECREHFTVTVGSVMERSHIPLTKWAAAFHLMCASKKGVRAHQLMRMLDIGSYRTAWFMAHRIREAMTDTPKTPLGGSGKTVEVDETYFGPKDRVTKRTKRGKPGLASKRAVVALVERGGEVRMFYAQKANASEMRDIMVRNIDRKSDLHTDESRLYTVTGEEFASHRKVTHSAGEYVRYDGDYAIHTNTVENVFSVFKRGMTGVYQHCGEAHLHRYLAEFGFRYNNRSGLGIEDAERTAKAVKSAGGKRLTYHQSGQAAHA